MANEQEQSLQKRPELVPERLMRGGLIVGVEQGIQGSLMSVTGAAIERITRERTEVPPQFKLPERPFYFLDPNTNRLIMISNREKPNPKNPNQNGLFAEIVQLDEEGNPHHFLPNSEILLPNENYQSVAVGPNEHGFPPSHIPVVEGETEGKKEFVPWNLYLGQLQTWMNDLQIDPAETLESYIKRYQALQARAKAKVESAVKKFFPGGNQAFSEGTLPVNLIICGDNAKDLLSEASRPAGFYPMTIKKEDLIEKAKYWNKYRYDIPDKTLYAMDGLLGSGVIPRGFSPALITVDFRYLPDIDIEFYLERGIAINLSSLPNLIQMHNDVFSYLEIYHLDALGAKEKPFYDDDEPSKQGAGKYSLSYSKNFDARYRGLLNKLKADLLLTMFVRGGAPIVK